MISIFRRRRRRVRSRSNYLLKNVNHDPHMELSKAQNGVIIHGGPGGGGGGDRSPMLKRAVSLGNTHTQRSLDYLNNTNSGTTTWHLKVLLLLCMVAQRDFYWERWRGAEPKKRPPTSSPSAGAYATMCTTVSCVVWRTTLV